MVRLSRLLLVTVVVVLHIGRDFRRRRRASASFASQPKLTRTDSFSACFSSVVGDKGEKAAPIKAAKTATKTTFKSGSPMEEAQTKILDFLFDIHMMGINSAAEEEVLAQSGYAHIKSTGYSKVMKVLTKESCYVEKAKGRVSLTDAGLKMMEANSDGSTNTPRTNKSIEDFYKKKIVKIGKKVPEEKLNVIWNLLSDRQAHSAASMLEAAGYKHPKSTGFCAIMKALKECQLLVEEGKGCWKFNEEKVFPYPE